MLNFKKYYAEWRKRLKNLPLKKKVVFIILVILLSLFGICLTLYLTGGRAKATLLVLRETFLISGACREECSQLRSEQADYLLASLKKNNRRLEKRFEKYLLSPDENSDFKEELLSLLAKSRGAANPPGYLKEYLVAETGDAELKSLISNYFYPEKDSLALAVYYYSWLDNQPEIELKLAAVRGLSNLPNKKAGFRPEQLENIKRLTVGTETDQRLRRALVLLLGDYYRLFPAETLAVWQEIYLFQGTDSISRAFAADFLNRYSGRKNWILPEISDTEWQDYYNN